MKALFRRPALRRAAAHGRACLLAVLVLALGACGDDGENDDRPAAPSATSTRAPAATPSATASATASASATAVPSDTATATVTPTATGGPLTETRCTVPPGSGVNFDPDARPCELLSSYRLFKNGARQEPNEGVLPYDLNTPLFSDFAEKYRFVWVPPGLSAPYDEAESFEFPVGSIIVKTFSYPHDFRNPAAGERLIETRLLLHRTNGWTPVTYVWNEDFSEARLRSIGLDTPVTWIDEDGAAHTIEYHVPNVNQCKECHNEHDDRTGLLGLKARSLNRDYPYPEGVRNQLTKLSEAGYVSGVPADPAEAPRNAVFDDPETGTVEQRARAYLDVNCGSCHNQTGLARTSGLYLTIHDNDPDVLGICKSPVAAGGGSGNLHYDVVPGKPEESILVYRMTSTKPGEAMPELGRQTVHTEAIEVISEWIRSLPGSCDEP